MTTADIHAGDRGLVHCPEPARHDPPVSPKEISLEPGRQAGPRHILTSTDRFSSKIAADRESVALAHDGLKVVLVAGVTCYTSAVAVLAGLA